MIELKNVTKSYDNNKIIVDKLNLKIEKGEFIVLIGESGCGKTTTMKMINRLIEPTTGKIYIEGKDIMSMDPIELRRKIGYVIQKVGLFPHMTVGQNIELIPMLQKWDKAKRKARAMELLDLVDLPANEYYNRYPNELSGGQQQRVGVIRALAANPNIILMDEPFSALDPLTREQLQKALLKLQDELQKTIIFVTHDMDEAIKLGDKIAVMKDGKILQYDTPERILKNPKDDFVEYFVGKNRLWKSPEMLFARDIMNKKVATISIKRSHAHAIELMKEKGVNTLVVLDTESSKPQQPLGIVRKKDLKLNEKHSAKIKDIMHTDLITVPESMNMVDVLNLMAEQQLKNVFVIDDNKNLSGIITQSSILNVITEVVTD
ncbi:MAG: osmoprotectant transport system ATP-binding protein [Epulopiscium sp.]|jgi:osmoprotectant transport system ATP-binding protein|nr:glycine betaine/L-proline transporter, ATPase subunit [Defluviitaleaceae bacterium]MDK2787756.1 osmoprotectant transport system ATP-binding protein [Candidatus Epulonipiscium sp.]